MRCRPLALPLALVALLIAAGGAVAQEPAPLPEAAPTAVADPAASAVPAPPLPDPAPDPQPPTPAPPAPDPPPPAPGPPPPAPAPAAAPPATAPAPAPAATARRPVTGPRERRRPRRARNQEQMDGRVVLFDGRVTVEEVPPARCSSDSCVIADYEIRGLGVRADRDGPALIEVTRARARGSATDRRIDVEVTLRPPGREAQSGSLELDPQDDLLDPATYGGSSLEAAIQEVLQALEPLIGEGGDLEGLVIRFGAGFVQPDGVAAVGVSTRTEGRVVLAPLERGEAPVPRLVGDSPDAGDDPQDETARALVQPVGGVMGDIQEPAAEAGGGGGGVATAVAGFAGSVVGALVTGACQAVGDREDCEAAEEPPPFVLDVLTVVLFVLDDGRGTVQVRCPAGYEGVTGILRLNTEISLGESFRRLADDVQFRCDERVEEVRVRLRPDALRRLEDEDALAARLTAIAVAAGGLRDTDLNVQVAVRLRSRERGSG